MSIELKNCINNDILHVFYDYNNDLDVTLIVVLIQPFDNFIRSIMSLNNLLFTISPTNYVFKRQFQIS